jgi:hypothetical protein
LRALTSGLLDCLLSGTVPLGGLPRFFGAMLVKASGIITYLGNGRMITSTHVDNVTGVSDPLYCLECGKNKFIYFIVLTYQ